MELVEIIRGAQDAMDRGDYRLAVAACHHVLETFPSSLTAHRMIGESVLELGDTDLAIGHFQHAIAIDPLNVVARLGLGVAAEEKRDMNQAYSAYLHAWEINPALDQVRDELVRLRGLLGGSERLHPTRAGLAGIFARGGQFGRAAAEWRAVLMSEPESRRAKTSLAEVHWRSGDDNAALLASREALTQSPDNVRALAMIADIETRRGSQTAPEFVERYQFADPAGEIMTILQDWREELDLSFLRRESAILADFDFSATPIEHRAPLAGTAASAVTGLGVSQFGAPDLWDNLIQDFKPGDLALDANGIVQPDVQPFAWFDDGATSSNGNAEPFSMESLSEPQATPPQTGVTAEPDSFEREFAALGNFATPGTQPIHIAESSIEPTFAPAHPEPAAEPTPATAQLERAVAAKPTKDQFVNADGGIDLTVGWDDLDRQLKDATPNFEPSHEMDALMAQLGVDGLQPFEVADSTFDDSAWVPFTDDDLKIPVRDTVTPQAAPTTVHSVPVIETINPTVVDEVLFSALAAPVEVVPGGWDIDNELLSAIPGQRSSGYTELFRHVDHEEHQDGISGEEINPFANPDAAGTPLDFEDLLAVTSRDGTAPLRPDSISVIETPAIEADTLLDSSWDAFQPPSIEPFDAVALDDIQSTANPEPQPFVFDDASIDFIPFEPQIVESLPVSPDLGLNSLFPDLGDVLPFSIEESFSLSRQESGDTAVDFTEINDAPFDPSSLPKLVVPPIPLPMADLVPDWVATAEAVSIEPSHDNRVVESAELHVESEQEALVAAAVPLAHNGGLGIRPGGVAWPAFVNHTSELIDRDFDGGNLFLRLRENKRAASAAGILVIDRTVVELRPASIQQSLPGRPVMQMLPPSESLRVATPGSQPLRIGWMTEEERLDLMAMRVRLIDDEGSAQEIAELLEVAVSRGLSDPLALRVLGEAYLKLGKTEQAAAQFRHAMLERRRSR